MKKLNYSFTLAIGRKNKRHKLPKFTADKKNVPAVCKLTEEGFVAIIHAGQNEEYGIPFTEDSYDLTGRTKVFGIGEDHKLYLRTADHAKHFPGLQSQYCSLRSGYDVVGDIVKANGKRLFRLKEVLNIHKPTDGDN